MNKISCIIIGLLIVWFLQAPINSSSITISQTSETITYGMPYNFDEYSVYTANSYATAQWNSAVYASLVKRSPTIHNWEPDLAFALPDISPDRFTYTFTLKNNLKFSNGHELTTSDVEFSFHVALSPAVNTNFYGSYIGFLNNDSVNVINSRTVEFTFIVLTAFPIPLLAFPIVDQEYFEDKYNRCLEGVQEDCLWDDSTGSDNVSAGPFKVEDIDTVNEIVILKANPFYYNVEMVLADKIVFNKIPEKDVALSALIAGKIDILDSQYVAGIDQLTELEGIREDFANEPSHAEFSINHLNPYFGTGEAIPGNEIATDQERYDDALLIRKAMSHVVNREFGVTEINEGLARAAATSFPAGSIGYDETLIPRNYSIEVARNYMEQAGFDYAEAGTQDSAGVWSSPFFEITVITPNSSFRRYMHWSSVFVLELPKIGIKVKEHAAIGWGEIVPRTFGYSDSTLVPGYDEGGFDIMAIEFGWSLDWNPKSLYDASGRCDTGDCNNFYNFDVDEDKSTVSSDIDSYLNEFDFDSRIIRAKELQKTLYENIPVIPMFYPISHWGFNEELSGIDTLLLSVSAQDWALVSNENFVSNKPKIGDSEESLALPIDMRLFLGFIGGVGLIIYGLYYKYKMGKLKGSDVDDMTIKI